jgi:Endonuclease-reverse transcriptase
VKPANIFVLLAGNFNRHNPLWGADSVRTQRQEEAELILLMMEDLSLTSLLPRGTTTWQNGDRESTIDPILASEELTERYLQCKFHETEHGSDHRAIETCFKVETPEATQQARALFKSASWGEIMEKVAEALNGFSRPLSTQDQANRLIGTVEKVVLKLTPKARPSPYAKRWWTGDLTQLR